MKTFEELELSKPISKAIVEMGYTAPSPIQAQTLPILLGDSTDFIGLAATGTGKTAAFSIPLLEKVDPSVRAVQGLILCPTRELALQVAGQIDLLGKFKGIKALPIYGGASYSDQIYGLKAGATIVVGTPGRVIDHMERGTLKLDKINTIILDEADEMISMGFKEDLETILKASPREEAQIWLFSATMSKEVRRVADTYLKNPKQVQVNRTEMLSTTVEQIYYMTRESDKPEILCKLIEAAEDFYGIVFCQTKSLVQDLTQYLTERGYKVDCLHGDKDQKSRERTMLAFRNRKVTVLVCTDVASRGLDVKDITHVINYSIPRELDNYVHRIGRTARSGKSGMAMSLVTPSHKGLIGRIENMTKSRMKEGTIPTRKDIGQKRLVKVLEKFQTQKFYQRAVDILGEEWKTAIAEMKPEEIVGRFLAMNAADIFEDRDTSRSALPGGNQEPSRDRDGGGGRRRERGGRDGGSRGFGGGGREGGRGRDFERGGRDGARSFGGDRDRSRGASSDFRPSRDAGSGEGRRERSGGERFSRPKFGEARRERPESDRSESGGDTRRDYPRRERSFETRKPRFSKEEERPRREGSDRELPGGGFRKSKKAAGKKKSRH